MNVRLLALLLVVMACTGQGAAPPAGAQTATRAKDLAAAAATITAEDMRSRIAYLASDELGGRDTPSPGLELAAEYLAREFAAAGLEPVPGGEGFIHRYPLNIRMVDTAQVELAVERGGKRETLAFGSEFAAAPGARAEVSGGAVYRALTSLASERGDEALRGRVVVTELEGTPGREWAGNLRAAHSAAENRGAAAIVFVLDPALGPDDVRQLARAFARVRGAPAGVPAFYVTREAAERAFGASGRTLAEALAADGGATVAGRVPVHDPGIRAPNVVALLRGSDPVLRDTYVVFSAHMDHVGIGAPDASGDSIYNGADDNASGTAALLEVAQAFAALEERPARSLIFLAVSGEEKGLLGSRAFTDDPPVPIESIVANINMDMIGRNSPDSIVAIGLDYSSLGPLTQEVARTYADDVRLTVAPDLWPEERLFFRSDHFNFAAKEIPAIFFFAGLHEDYHRASDHAEKIDADKAARVARLVFYLGHRIASDPEPPQWTEQGLAEVRALTSGRRR